jgi:hypothetical protein
MRNGKVGDKHSRKVVAKPLHGYPAGNQAIADESGPMLPPLRYEVFSQTRAHSPPTTSQPNPKTTPPWTCSHKPNSAIFPNLTQTSPEPPSPAPRP